MKSSPPREALSRLRTPLTTGESSLIQFLDGALDDRWECYIQPHLNSLRPDIVLLHEFMGVAVFEVKDWTRNTLQVAVAQVEAGRRRPGFPLAQLADYRRELVSRYSIAAVTYGWRSINSFAAAIFFPLVPGEAVRQLLGPWLERFGLGHDSGASLLGSDDLVGIARVLPLVTAGDERLS